MESEKKYLSQEKFSELTQELDVLKKEKRKEIAEQLEYAKSLGDLSENAEYHEARDAQAKVEQRILDIEHILKNAEIVKDEKRSFADVGSTVTVKGGDDTKKEIWEIVGSEEADFAHGKISNESPIGSALIGKRVGDMVEVATPRGKTSYTIVKIS